MKTSINISSILRATMSALLLLSAALTALAQQQTATRDFPSFSATPTGKGIMLTSRQGAPDFAVLIAGGTAPRHDAADSGLRIKTTDGGEIVVFRADAKLYALTKTDTPETLMKNYRARIIPPVKPAPGEIFAVDTELNAMLPVFDLRVGKDEKALVYASSWRLPLSGSNTARRVYLSFVIGDSILTLRKDMPNDEDTAEQNEALMGALQTLTILPPQRISAAPKKRPASPVKRKN